MLGERQQFHDIGQAFCIRFVHVCTRDLPNDTEFVRVSMSDAFAKEFNAFCARNASVPELEIAHDFRDVSGCFSRTWSVKFGGWN
jgi:hypothetical protein